jgi:FemAB-related protein (PEP-CTERM system-associated)
MRAAVERARSADPAPAVVVRPDAPASAAAAYAGAHPDGTPYHDPAWLDVIARAFGHRTLYLAAEAGGRTAGVLPLVFFSSRVFGRFAVSVPFVNYGGVLADTPDVERALVDRAIAETRAAGGSYLELRHTRRRFTDLSEKRHKVAMWLTLDGTPDAQWASLDRKLRNQVRKAEKHELEIRTGGLEALPAFYEVFARNMRDLGTPVYGVGFFREVLSAFPETTRVFVVRHAGRAVAASLVQWRGEAVEVPWASALRESNALCANVFLYWHMLRFAVERGLRRFDFGRSTPGEGTFLFKKQWGAEPVPLVWEYWTASGQPMPDLSPKNPKYARAISAWQRLPVSIANALGPAIVRHIP